MKRLPQRPVLRPKNLGGAPLGNRNAFKTGVHTRAMQELRARAWALCRSARQTLADIGERRRTNRIPIRHSPFAFVQFSAVRETKPLIG